MEKKLLILGAEKQFAREVTLGAIVANPPAAWYYLIPGMFIIDFLRRESALRRYTKYFMFPRNLAMDAALAIIEEDDETSVVAHVRRDMASWLNSQNRNTPDLIGAHMAWMDVLINYYRALLKAGGDSYYLLIQNAYQDRDNLRSFFAKITAAEHAIDRLVIEKSGSNLKIQNKILTEQQQIEKRRDILLDAVFS